MLACQVEGLSGCCVATSLVACPGFPIAWEPIPLKEGIGGDCAAVRPGLQLGSPFLLDCSLYNAYMWEPSSNQPG